MANLTEVKSFVRVFGFVRVTRGGCLFGFWHKTGFTNMFGLFGRFCGKIVRKYVGKSVGKLGERLWNKLKMWSSMKKWWEKSRCAQVVVESFTGDLHRDLTEVERRFCTFST